MFMFNEFLIHLCDCTWLNVMYILKHLLIKPKNIFEYFSCFWKVFCFENFTKIQNFSTLPFGDSLVSREFTQNASWLIGEEELKSQKRLRTFFKIWVLDFLATHSRVASSFRGVYDSQRVRVPIVKKTYRNFSKSGFKGFWRLTRESVKLRKTHVLQKYG